MTALGLDNLSDELVRWSGCGLVSGIASLLSCCYPYLNIQEAIVLESTRWPICHIQLMQSDDTVVVMGNGLYGLWLEGMFLFWYEIVSLVTLLYSGAPPRRNALDLAFLVNIRLFSVLRILKRILLQWTWPADTLFANQCITCSCFVCFWMSKVKSWIGFQHNKLCYDFCQIWHIVKNLIFIFKILSTQFLGFLQRNICVRIRFGKMTRKITKIV